MQNKTNTETIQNLRKNIINIYAKEAVVLQKRLSEKGANQKHLRDFSGRNIAGMVLATLKKAFPGTDISLATLITESTEVGKRFDAMNKAIFEKGMGARAKAFVQPVLNFIGAVLECAKHFIIESVLTICGIARAYTGTESGEKTKFETMLENLTNTAPQLPVSDMLKVVQAYDGDKDLTEAQALKIAEKLDLMNIKELQAFIEAVEKEVANPAQEPVVQV